MRMAVSIGVAAFPDMAGNMDDLVARADAALYAAKRAGKDRVEVYWRRDARGRRRNRRRLTLHSSSAAPRRRRRTSTATTPSAAIAATAMTAIVVAARPPLEPPAAAAFGFRFM